MVISKTKYKCDFLNALASFSINYHTFGIKNGVEILLIETFRASIGYKWYEACRNINSRKLCYILNDGVDWIATYDPNMWSIMYNNINSKYHNSNIEVPIELRGKNFTSVYTDYVKNNSINEDYI